jgi:hypothetical protein
LIVLDTLVDFGEGEDIELELEEGVYELEGIIQA